MRPQTFLKHYLSSKLRNPGRLSARSVGGIALALLALWGVERWGGDLIPNAWKLPLSGKDCRVEKISDGDTMNLRCGTQLVKVRLYCIDAPEMAQKPWGTRSREHLQSITTPTVKLLKIDQDQYGRTVTVLTHIAWVVRDDDHGPVFALFKQLNAAFLMKTAIAHSHDFVDQEAVKLHHHADGKSQAGAHASGIAFDRFAQVAAEL